jgi:multicomponent Na+:H+ antiporter subunit C
MTLVLILAISLCVGAGILLMLSHDAFRIVVGFAVLGAAVNLIVFLAGRPYTLVPPVIPQGSEALAEDAANPLTQALVLTAIVIGFALLCFSLVLAARVSRDHGHSDVTRQQASEPRPDPAAADSFRPPVMEDE